jgi:hypothetical protein
MIQTDELEIKDSPRHAALPRFVLLAPTASPTTVAS